MVPTETHRRRRVQRRGRRQPPPLVARRAAVPLRVAGLRPAMVTSRICFFAGNLTPRCSHTLSSQGEWPQNQLCNGVQSVCAALYQRQTCSTPDDTYMVLDLGDDEAEMRRCIRSGFSAPDMASACEGAGVTKGLGCTWSAGRTPASAAPQSSASASAGARSAGSRAKAARQARTETSVPPAHERERIAVYDRIGAKCLMR